MTTAAVTDLAPPVQRVLEDVVAAARVAFGPALRSVVLFGSGAEGRLRATSDLNVVFVLTAFEREAIDRLREPLRVAEAAVRMRPMFLAEAEIPAAAEAFAAKFADLRRRHRVLFGSDPFAALEIPRAAQVARLRQALLNLTLRLRAEYALRSLREEQLAVSLAEAAAPLRSCAATLLELAGQAAPSPREALARVAAETGVGGAGAALASLSQARETRTLPAGAAGGVLFTVLELAEALRRRADALA